MINEEIVGGRNERAGVIARLWNDVSGRNKRYPYLGNKLKKEETMQFAPVPEWLDYATYALVLETVHLLVKRHKDILLAIILFGSVARHEERPLDDPCPSDVDLLAIVDTTDSLVEPYRESIYYTIGDACYLHLDAPREVNVLLADRTLQGWDTMFLENVAHEGIILYARGPLPEALIAKASLVEN